MSSKAEKFIQDYTMNCSNEVGGWTNGEYSSFYKSWLTPDQARNAVEIAREEIYEWVRVNLCNYFDDTRETFDKFIDDLKQSMKDG